MLKPAAASILLLALLAPPVPAQEPGPPERAIPEDPIPAPADRFLLPLEVVLDRAGRMLDRTDRDSTERAHELYGYALEIDPESAEAHAGLARTLVIRYTRRWEPDDSLPEKAEAAARKAVELAPRSASTRAALAYALMALEQWDLAGEAADRAWSLRSPEDPTWIDGIYAQSLLSRWRREEALEVTARALERRPDRAALHALEGLILIEMERYGDALRSLQRAYILEPRFGPAILRMGYAQARLGNPELAARYYSRVSRDFPEERGRAYILMAASLIGRKQFRRALNGLKTIDIPHERGLGEGTRLYLMALCHEKLGQEEEAASLYRLVAREHPLASLGSIPSRSASVAAYEALARLALDHDRLPEAAGLLEEALDQGRPTIGLFTSLAEVYAEHELKDEAASILARGAATDFGPRLAGPKLRIHVAWARLLRDGGSPAGAEGAAAPLEALERDREAILATENEAYYLEAARVAALLGAPEVGLAWLRSAVDRGYRRLEWIREDEEMSSLAGLPGFDLLLEPAPGS